jgi:hypothetical protein
MRGCRKRRDVDGKGGAVCVVRGVGSMGWVAEQPVMPGGAVGAVNS